MSTDVWRTTNRFILLTTTIQLAAHTYIAELMSALFYAECMSVCVRASKHSIVDDSLSAQHAVKLFLSLHVVHHACKRCACLNDWLS